VLNEDGPVNGHRPSADVLFNSVAREFGPQAIAVLMTGMGEDGATGMGEIQAAGGLTIAQSRKTCVVYGMPKAAVERGFAARVVDLQDLPAVLQSLCAVARVDEGDATKSTATKAGSS
jgi:two-component system, chemotaxis family, protein-glutamate methylesterase/glutaminase